MISKVLNGLPFSPLEGRRWPIGSDEGFTGLSACVSADGLPFASRRRHYTSAALSSPLLKGRRESNLSRQAHMR